MSVVHRLVGVAPFYGVACGSQGRKTMQVSEDPELVTCGNCRRVLEGSVQARKWGSGLLVLALEKYRSTR